MLITSAEAAKAIRSLTSEFNDLIKLEGKTSSFVAAVGEDPESVRPEYSFEETRKKEEFIFRRLRKLRHALNIFNSTTEVPGFDMTIDEVLVYLPQLNNKVARLSKMKSVLPKQRVEGYGRQSVNLIDYSYANYDVKKAEEEYLIASATLAKLQLALDAVNSTKVFEFDFDEPDTENENKLFDFAFDES